jgi:hypothetical protein
LKKVQNDRKGGIVLHPILRKFKQLDLKSTLLGVAYGMLL